LKLRQFKTKMKINNEIKSFKKKSDKSFLKKISVQLEKGLPYFLIDNNFTTLEKPWKIYRKPQH
jgi:hypothetical protein